MSDFLKPIKQLDPWVTTGGKNKTADKYFRMEKIGLDAERIESQISQQENELQKKETELNEREKNTRTEIVSDKTNLYLAIGTGVILVMAFYYFYYNK